MKIEFYNKKTMEKLDPEDYFILNGDEVWRNNHQYWESQASCISFEDCIEKCDPDLIGWSIVLN